MHYEQSLGRVHRESMYEQPYWIAGLSAPEVLDRLKERGLSCRGPTPRGETMSAWECKGSSRESDASYEVSIIGRDAERVRSVTARVRSERGMPPEEVATGFLAFVASLPYEGAQSAQAQQWVRDSAGSGGKLSLGNANLELLSEEEARVLRIVSSEPG
jgi:hypothetical protein